LIETRGFIYRREIKRQIKKNILIREWIKKISDLSEEGETETARKLNVGMKTRQVLKRILRYIKL